MRYDVVEGVATLTMDHVENRNALTAELLTGLGTNLERAIGDNDARVIVLTNEGPAFCAGADLKGGTRRKSALRRIELLAEEAEALVDDDDGFAEHDLQFHSAVVEATGSTTLAELSKMLFQIIEAHNAVFIAAHPRGFSSTVNRQAQRAYLRLAKLLNDGDIEGAQKHWRRHLEAAATYMIGDEDSALVEVLS